MLEQYTKTYWVVYHGEGEREPGRPGEAHTSKEAAYRAARGKGWYGGTASVSEFSGIEHNGAVQLLGPVVPLGSPLTEEERRRGEISDILGGFEDPANADLHQVLAVLSSVKGATLEDLEAALERF